MADVDEGGAILLDARAGRFYHLNPAGAAFWSALAETGDFETGVAAVVARFDAQPAVIRADLAAFAEELERCGLVRWSG